jgi:hypothetical protein
MTGRSSRDVTATVHRRSMGLMTLNRPGEFGDLLF